MTSGNNADRSRARSDAEVRESAHGAASERETEDRTGHKAASASTLVDVCARWSRRTDHSLAGRFAELRPVLPGEAAEMPKPEIRGRTSHRVPGIGRPTACFSPPAVRRCGSKTSVTSRSSRRTRRERGARTRLIPRRVRRLSRLDTGPFRILDARINDLGARCPVRPIALPRLPSCLRCSPCGCPLSSSTSHIFPGPCHRVIHDG